MRGSGERSLRKIAGPRENDRAMIDIETGSANVYADLGRADAEEMLVKAQLASKIGEILKRRKLTQEQAAEILGIP
jgi:predicted XRE-type DNA-binding protein